MDALKSLPMPKVGFSATGSNSTSASHRDRVQSIQVTNDTGSTLGAHSCFSIQTEAGVAKDEPVKCSVKRIGGSAQGGSPWALLTNGEIAIPNGETGWASFIGYDEPVLLAYSGTKPKCGDPVGPIGDGSAVVAYEDSGRFGLIALSTGTMDNESEALVWCIRSSEPGNLMMETTETITGRSGSTLGKGDAKMLVRADNTTEAISDYKSSSGGSTRVFRVYNLGTEAIPSGTKVIAKACTGVGLVVEPTTAGFTNEAAIVGMLGDDTWDTDNGTIIFQAGDYIGPGFTAIPNSLDLLAADEVEGIKILADGLYLIIASVATETVSPEAPILINDGDDLCTLLDFQNGSFWITCNDDALDGSSSGTTNILPGMNFSDMALCSYRGKTHWCDFTIGEFVTDDEIRMWRRWAHAVGEAKPAGTYYAQFGIVRIR